MRKPDTLRDSHGNISASIFPLVLLLAFLVIAGLLAIHPLYPRDWALENLIVVASLPVLVYGYRHLRFSNVSYFALFVLYVAHEVGAHYTYAEVPFDVWTMKLFGFSLTEHFGFSRNHYDRLVHFLYGVLVTPAVVELLAARAQLRGIWRWILPVSFVLSHAALYELLEWAAVILFGGELGQAYLGTQGDPWDAHQDILLALLGSMLVMPLLCHRGSPSRLSKPSSWSDVGGGYTPDSSPPDGAHAPPM